MKKAFIIVSVLLLATLIALFYIKYENKGYAKSESGALKDFVEVYFLDVGQGDSAFIEFRNDKQMLVDCGKDSKVLSGLGEVMPFYDKYIDYILVTHADLDHFGGCIDVLHRFDVGKIVYNGTGGDTDAWNYFWNLIQEKDIEIIPIEGRDFWDFDDVYLKFLYPDGQRQAENKNDGSIVFVMSYGENDILFTGDAEESLESYLLDNHKDSLDVEILKVSHHGSGGSSDQDFLYQVSPEYSVISVGEDNGYGHPSLRTIRRLERAGGEILRTDLQGSVGFNIYKDEIEVVFE